jgi:phage-related protein
LHKCTKIGTFIDVNKPEKTLQADFYSHTSGTEPVREWLLSLDDEAKKAIGGDIKSIEYGWPIGMPTVKALGNGLWEVRTNLDKKTARVLFCIAEVNRMVLLHGFIKKSQKTLKKDIDLARVRMRSVLGGQR